MKVNIISLKTVFEGFLKVEEAELQHAKYNGQMSEKLTRQCLERGDSAAAILYHRDRQTAILIEQFRYPTYQKSPGWITEVVAGVVEEGETPQETIRREVQEEAGFQLRDIQEIAHFYVSPGGSSERIFLYFAEVSDEMKTGVGGGNVEEAEDIRLLEYSVADLKRLLTAGEILDAKTIIAAQYFLISYLEK